MSVSTSYQIFMESNNDGRLIPVIWFGSYQTAEYARDAIEEIGSQGTTYFILQAVRKDWEQT